jgi:Ca2+-binding EF-hand superfamily protein
MPKGLPDWFARNDEDADGQITMAEYATLWNDAKATEFAKFDLDGDGVITPRECLRSQELETKRK